LILQTKLSKTHKTAIQNKPDMHSHVADPPQSKTQARRDPPLPEQAQRLLLQDSPATYKGKLFSLSIFALSITFYLLSLFQFSILSFYGCFEVEEDG
jgi:hypothetical protein